MNAWSGELQGVLKGCNAVTAVWLADYFIGNLQERLEMWDSLRERMWGNQDLKKGEKMNETKGKITPRALIHKDPYKVARGADWDTACKML